MQISGPNSLPYSLINEYIFYALLATKNYYGEFSRSQSGTSRGHKLTAGRTITIHTFSDYTLPDEHVNLQDGRLAVFSSHSWK